MKYKTMVNILDLEMLQLNGGIRLLKISRAGFLKQVEIRTIVVVNQGRLLTATIEKPMLRNRVTAQWCDSMDQPSRLYTRHRLIATSRSETSWMKGERLKN
jgi:hypothetical protein